MKPRDPDVRRLLVILLVVSAGLRIYLASAGGQFFFPDERRYETSREIVALLLAGNLGDATETAAQFPHLGFRVVGIVPALIERVVGESAVVPAAFFGLFSVANIWLLFAIARRAGASDPEALLAAFLLSLSSTSFYYARHLLPYDVGLTLALAAILAAVRTPARLRDAALCGLLAGCSFLVYLGYWTVAAFAVLLPAFQPSLGFAKSARRLAVSSLAFVAPFVVMFGVDASLGGNLIGKFIRFSGDPGLAIQGLFSEGWRLPFAYLWHAEHGLFVAWLLALGAAVPLAASRRLARSASLGVFGVLFVYAALVVLSVGLEKYVVLGRLVRQCVPFFCLLTAHWLERLRTLPGTRATLAFRALIALACIQAAANFHTPLTQVFPDEFGKLAVRAGAAHQASHPSGQYRVLRAKSLYPAPRKVTLPPHVTLLAAPHPTEFLPYQYEEYTPDQRAVLRATDIRMRLVYIQDGPIQDGPIQDGPIEDLPDPGIEGARAGPAEREPS